MAVATGPVAGLDAAPAAARPGADGDASVPPGVLFVDDEEGVLAGLRTSLRKLRRDYTFHFALGGAEALDVLAAEPVQLVVTDMRMPGMNGVELLRQVKARYPDVVRYVLSGEADQSLVMQAVPVTHRWLTKPCPHDYLVDAVAQGVRHRSLLADPDILSVIGGIDALPATPPLYRELVRLLDDPKTSVVTVAEVIGADAAVSAKLLQWANSAFAGWNRVVDIRSAVVRLGLAMVSYLVLRAEMVCLLDERHAVPGMGLNELRRHERSMGLLGSTLARPDEALAAGTAAGLASTGLLLEAEHLPGRLAASYELAEAEGLTITAAERRLYGVTHCDLGGHLLSVWGLPSELVLAVEGSYDLPAPAVGPLGLGEAVRAARLAVQSLPYYSSVGQPHRDPITPPLEAAVRAWLGALAEREDAL